MIKRKKGNNYRKDLLNQTNIFDFIFESTNDAILISSLKGNLIDVNQNTIKLTGFDPDDLIGYSIFKLFHSQEVSKIKEKLNLLSIKDCISYIESTLLSKDNSKKLVSIGMQLISKKNGKPLYFLFIIQDISARLYLEESIMKQAVIIVKNKEEIDKSEEEKIRILNAIDDLILYYEEGMKIRWANLAAAKSVNKTQAEIIGEHCYKIWGERETICEDCPVNRARLTLLPQSKEMTTPDGRIWLVRGLPIIEDGKLKSVVEITREITEMKSTQEKMKNINIDLERKVRERTSQLEFTNNELKSFSYSISHDLRAPIRRISSFTDLLSKELEQALTEGTLITKYIQAIKNSTIEMNNFIEGMLSLSQVNQTELERKEINLKKMIEKIKSENLAAFDKRKINWNIEDDLPVIFGDQTLIFIVFTNLILNSLKFTGKQKKTIIAVGYDKSQSDDFFDVIFVRDNGIGFDMKHLDKLFKPFQRLHSNEFEGTGIGLATVKRIIHKHNGLIWADSNQSKTTFYIKLPKNNS